MNFLSPFVQTYLGSDEYNLNVSLVLKFSNFNKIDICPVCE